MVPCGPPQPQPWGGAHGAFPGEKGKAGTPSGLHNPGQEDRARRCQPAPRQGWAEWGQHRGAIWHGACVELWQGAGRRLAGIHKEQHIPGC